MAGFEVITEALDKLFHESHKKLVQRNRKVLRAAIGTD
jgi:hypothetical protein